MSPPHTSAAALSLASSTAPRRRRGWLQGLFTVDVRSSRLHIIGRGRAGEDRPVQARVNALYPLGQDRFLAATSWGLLVSLDGGQSWDPCAGDALALDPLVLLRSGPEDLLAFTASGPYRSADGGVFWERWEAPGLPSAWDDAEAAALQGDRLAVVACGNLWWASLRFPSAARLVEPTRVPHVSALLPLEEGFLIGTRSGALFEVYSPEDLRAVGQLPGAVSALTSWQGTTLALAAGCLWTLHPHRAATPLPAPWLGLQARLLAVEGEPLLLHNHREAWVCWEDGWRRVEGFPAGATALALQRGVLLVSDQQRIQSLTLAALLDCALFLS